MNFIDFILNVVGLLFWLNWRAVHASVIAHPGGSLSSTLKAANSPRPRWFYLGLLIGLLLVRAFFYWQIGPALPWNPRLDLGFTTLTFRSDFFGQILSYSFLSFAAALWVLYLWIVLLACINANASEEDSIHRFFQLHLGFVKSWPTALKLVAPLGAVIVFWLLLHPILTPKCSLWHVFAQGAIIGLIGYINAQYLLAGILILHLLNSYVYIGDLSFLKYIDSAANRLLRPLRQRWLPLVVKRIDFAPVLAIALILEICALLTWASQIPKTLKCFAKLAS